MERGYKLTTLTRHPWHMDGADNKTLANYDMNKLESYLKGQDVVIHLAAIAHQSRQKSPDSDNHLKKINIDNARILALAAKKAGVKRFIFLSSIKVLGEATEKLPFNETSPPLPEDDYGRSKLAAEQGLHEILDNSDTELVIIRPPLVWGGAMKGNLALLQRLIALGIPLPFGGIGNRRDLVSITNLCLLICCVIHHPAAPGNAFLVSDGVARTTAQIAQLVAPSGSSPKLFNCPASLLRLIAKMPLIGGKLVKLVGSLEVDIGHTKRLLGWSPKGVA